MRMPILVFASAIVFATVCRAGGETPPGGGRLPTRSLILPRMTCTVARQNAGALIHCPDGSSAFVGGVNSLDLELDETSGTTFADSSGNGADAAASNSGVTAGVAGSGAGGAHAVDFTGGYLHVTDHTRIPSSPQVYVEAWIKTSIPNDSTRRSILGKNGAYALTVQSNNIIFNIQTTRGSNGNITVGGLLPDQSWTHVAAWYNGRNIVIAIDDITYAASCDCGPLQAGTDFYVGASEYSSDNFMGQMDEVRVRPIAPFP